METLYVTKEQYESITTIEQDFKPWRSEKQGIEYIHCEGSTCLLVVNEEAVEAQKLKIQIHERFMEREEHLNNPTRRALLEANSPICNCGGRTKLINADALDTKNPTKQTARWKCYKCKTKFLFEPDVRFIPSYMQKPNLPDEAQRSRDEKIVMHNLTQAAEALNAVKQVNDTYGIVGQSPT